MPAAHVRHLHNAFDVLLDEADAEIRDSKPVDWADVYRGRTVEIYADVVVAKPLHERRAIHINCREVVCQHLRREGHG